MTSKEALKHITENDFNMIIATYPPKPAYNGLTKEDMITIIEKDLELLDCFLNCFKSSILEATDSQNRRGDNILTDTLRDELGLITLNKLKERLENE